MRTRKFPFFELTAFTQGKRGPATAGRASKGTRHRPNQNVSCAFRFMGFAAFHRRETLSSQAAERVRNFVTRRRYYGVPMNNSALTLFRFQVGRLWHRALL